jgi:hypothetical protein
MEGRTMPDLVIVVSQRIRRTMQQRFQPVLADDLMHATGGVSMNQAEIAFDEIPFETCVVGPGSVARSETAAAQVIAFKSLRPCGVLTSYGCGPHGAGCRSFTSWVISKGRNFEAKPSTKSLFANTAAQCARRSASSSNFQRCTS